MKKNQKGITLILLILMIVTVLIIGGVLIGIVINKDNDKSLNSNKNLNNNTPNKVDMDLSVDENVSKSINCSIVEDSSNFDVIMLNWNRYTFLKDEFKDEQEQEEGKSLKTTYIYSDDFDLRIRYDIDSEYVLKGNKTFTEKALTDSILYEQLGSPTIYGNENGYWYTYMYKDSSNYKDGDDNNLCIQIKKEVGTGENSVGTRRYILNIYIQTDYKTEEGKMKLSYLFEDLKEIFRDGYNIDLSELTIDLIKK